MNDKNDKYNLNKVFLKDLKAYSKLYLFNCSLNAQEINLINLIWFGFYNNSSFLNLYFVGRNTFSVNFRYTEHVAKEPECSWEN